MTVLVIASRDRVRDVVLRHPNLHDLVRNAWVTVLAGPAGDDLLALGTELDWHPVAGDVPLLDTVPSRPTPVHPGGQP